MPSLMPKPEFKKAFYSSPGQWLQQHQLDDAGVLTSDIELWLAKREQALLDGKALKLETGKLSREIGALKKSGQPADEPIAAMKMFKQQQKALDKVTLEAELLIYETIQQRLDERAGQTEALLAPKVARLDYAALIIEPLTSELREACIAYVESTPTATFYHHPECCELIEKSFGHNWQYFVAAINGEVVGVLPVVALKSKLFGCFGVSMPFFNYGGPIGESDEVIKALLSASEQYAQEDSLGHIEHRCLAPLPQYPGHQNKDSMWLPLPASADELWQAIGSKVRAQVNKATSHGLTVHIGGAELLDDFYGYQPLLGVAEQTIEKFQLDVFPNPIQYKTTITSTFAIEDVQITNAYGKNVTDQFSFSGGGLSKELYQNNLASGMYFIQVSGKSAQETSAKSIFIK